MEIRAECWPAGVALLGQMRTRMESYKRILVITAVLPCLLIGQRNEKKVRLGVSTFDGVITSIESFHGQFVRVGTQFIFKPYDYALTVTSLQHHQDYLCVQRHLGDGMTTGDQVKVKGSVVQIQNKQTGDVLSLKLDGCKIQSRQSTRTAKADSSQARLQRRHTILYLSALP